ncbi:MAG: hypothetical protein FWE07_02485 [Turicibacter sp.]|nr:hypothetical protein [Turicibacter sp.]
MKGYEQEKMQRSSLLLGIIGALIGAIIGSIPWIIAFNLNWIIGFLGAVIGYCAMKGYELLKGPDGLIKMVVVITSSLLVVLLVQYFSTVFWHYRDWQGGRFSPTFLDVMDAINDALFTDAVFTRYFLIDSGMGMLFAIFGISGLFKQRNGEVDLLANENDPTNDLEKDTNDLNDFDF